MLLGLDAMAKLEEMRNSGELCCIDISSDYMYCWDVSFVREDNGHMTERPLGSFIDLNEAIVAAHQVWKGTYSGKVLKVYKHVSWREDHGEYENLHD